MGFIRYRQKSKNIVKLKQYLEKKKEVIKEQEKNKLWV
jgi:hypothetical protein